jgi:trehalose-6-phosphate synthase
MTPEERQQRMRWLRSHVHRNDVYRWVKSIFSSLKDLPAKPPSN